MKRLLAAILLALSTAGIAGAINLTTDQTLTNTTVTSTTSFTFDMLQAGINKISAQVNVSSTSPTSSTFNDGRTSTGSFVLTSTAALKGANATNTLTVTTNSALKPAAGTNTINISSNALTDLAGAVITLTAEGNTLTFKNGFQWATGVSSITAATSIASAINGQRYWTATSAGSTVTITCVTAGAACNSYTLATSTPTLLVPGSANFTGGLDNTYFQINGQRYIQGIDWTQAALSSNTTVSMAGAVNSEDVYGITAATTSTTVVTLTVTIAGAAGNAFTLTSSSNTALTRGGATFSGGRAHPTVTAGKTTVTEGTNWAVDVPSQTVINLANALGAASTQVSTSTINNSNSSGTIIVTSLNVGSVGSGTAYKLATTATSGITPAQGNMIGGANSAISGSVINIPAHGLATGQAVLFSTSSNTGLSPLINQTTYYIVAVDANDVEVSTTQAQALAGTHITLLSPSITGPHNFTLAPLAYSGTSVLTWYGSNDGVNYSAAPVSAQTASTSNMPTSFLWDFGSINYRFLQLQVAGPTNGGLLLNVQVHGTN